MTSKLEGDDLDPRRVVAAAEAIVSGRCVLGTRETRLPLTNRLLSKIYFIPEKFVELSKSVKDLLLSPLTYPEALRDSGYNAQSRISTILFIGLPSALITASVIQKFPPEFVAYIGSASWLGESLISSFLHTGLMIGEIDKRFKKAIQDTESVDQISDEED